jgi:hypothetical protein
LRAVAKRLQFLPTITRPALRLRHIWQWHLVRPPASHPPPRLQGRAIGDAIQEIADGLARPHRRRLANENKKSGLKSVVGVVYIAEDAPADATHHRAVTPQQRLERGFVASGDEMLQQLTVRPLLAQRLKGDAAKMMQQAIAVPHRRGGGPAPPR